MKRRPGNNENEKDGVVAPSAVKARQMTADDDDEDDDDNNTGNGNVVEIIRPVDSKEDTWSLYEFDEVGFEQTGPAELSIFQAKKSKESGSASSSMPCCDLPLNGIAILNRFEKEEDDVLYPTDEEGHRQEVVASSLSSPFDFCCPGTYYSEPIEDTVEL